MSKRIAIINMLGNKLVIDPESVLAVDKIKDSPKKNYTCDGIKFEKEDLGQFANYIEYVNGMKNESTIVVGRLEEWQKKLGFDQIQELNA